MKTGFCKGCGRPVVWAKIVKVNPETGEKSLGRACPMDPRPPIYRVAPTGEGGAVAYRANGDEAPTASDGGVYMISHFVTCPKASEFSGSRAKASEPA